MTVALGLSVDDALGEGVTRSTIGKSSRNLWKSSGARTGSHVTTEPTPGSKAFTFPSGTVRVRTLLAERLRICFASVIRSDSFNPESVLTEHGHQMLANWLVMCGDKGARERAVGLSPVVSR